MDSLGGVRMIRLLCLISLLSGVIDFLAGCNPQLKQPPLDMTNYTKLTLIPTFAFDCQPANGCMRIGAIHDNLIHPLPECIDRYCVNGDCITCFFGALRSMENR
jgi:hypothetical protein